MLHLHLKHQSRAQDISIDLCLRLTKRTTAVSADYSLHEACVAMTRHPGEANNFLHETLTKKNHLQHEPRNAPLAAAESLYRSPI